MRSTRGSGWYLVGIVSLIAALVLALALAGCGWKSRADECVERGGVVNTEVEYKTKTVTGKDGNKLKKRVAVTEHECIVNGQEVDEW